MDLVFSVDEILKSSFHLKINSGIYCITCLKNKKRYIGSSRALKSRLRSHIRELKKGSHPNAHLQNTWNKYVPVIGTDIFSFKILTFIPDENLLQKSEQAFIDHYNSRDPSVGFNLAHANRRTAKQNPEMKQYFITIDDIEFRKPFVYAEPFELTEKIPLTKSLYGKVSTIPLINAEALHYFLVKTREMFPNCDCKNDCVAFKSNYKGRLFIGFAPRSRNPGIRFAIFYTQGDTPYRETNNIDEIIMSFPSEWKIEKSKPGHHSPTMMDFHGYLSSVSDADRLIELIDRFWLIN